MTPCQHRNLVLLPAAAPRLRCRHCHLTLAAEELGRGPCPECREATGRQRFDFEPVAPGPRTVRYRCEDCGALMAAAGAASGEPAPA
jgi:predicted RNA-binding Zn-ribbon protein involved in translation (DUF1610 family)